MSAQWDSTDKKIKTVWSLSDWLTDLSLPDTRHTGAPWRWVSFIKRYTNLQDLLSFAFTHFCCDLWILHGILCSVFRNMANKDLAALANWYKLTLCCVSDFVLSLLICSQLDSIAHALLRCYIAVSNFWYICPMDVCRLLLCFLVLLLFRSTLPSRRLIRVDLITLEDVWNVC